MTYDVILIDSHMEFDDTATLHPEMFAWLLEHVGFGDGAHRDEWYIGYLLEEDEYPNVWGWEACFIYNKGTFKFKDADKAMLFKLTWG